MTPLEAYRVPVGRCREYRRTEGHEVFIACEVHHTMGPLVEKGSYLHYESKTPEATSQTHADPSETSGLLRPAR